MSPGRRTPPTNGAHASRVKEPPPPRPSVWLRIFVVAIFAEVLFLAWELLAGLGHLKAAGFL